MWSNCMYSGGQLKRTSNVSFCASITTESMKTNNIPLKNPTKFLPEMKKNSNFSNILGLLGPFLKKKVVLENGQLWNLSIFLNETFRRASSLRLIENECIVDGYGSYLMPATPIFQKLTFSKKVPKTKQILKISNFFFISGSNFVGHFNGILFVLILSVVIEAEKETLLSRFNWPPLYDGFYRQ